MGPDVKKSNKQTKQKMSVKHAGYSAFAFYERVEILKSVAETYVFMFYT